MYASFDPCRVVLPSVLLVALVLAGCSRSGPPAPVIQADRQVLPPPVQQEASLPPATQPTAPAPVERSAGRSIVVKPGDTLYSIARDNGVPLRALIDANRLRAPYALEPGARLALPDARYHVVRRGDTLYGIARLYGVAMRELVQANNIAPPYAIAVGSKLTLPANQGPALAARSTTASDAQPAGATQLPPAEAAPAEPSPADIDLAARTPAQLPLAEPPPRAADGQFLWPIRGRILVAFGPRGGGLHNDGINIAAREGSEIRAAESGVVVYAGNQLQGFGNLLLVRHADDWMTAYGHASAILVKRGEVVRRGQTIARVGRTGNVSQPQLHFEIRRNDKAVDPMRYLARLALREDRFSTATAFPAGRRDPG